jgi:aminoglycoside/choline kinase family phosphotransferase
LKQVNSYMPSSAGQRISSYLEGRKRTGLRVVGLTPMVGDASERSYYRVRLEEGSMVLALLSRSFDPLSLPFLNVAELCRQIPIRIPHIHHVSGPQGILLLEDLGDDLLQASVATVDRAAKRDLYLEAVNLLARLQSRGHELRSDRYMPYRLAFDHEKLFDELRFFEEHFLVGYRKVGVSSEAHEALESSFHLLASELASLPRVLCHRDYHSRNLMVLEDGLAVIDFQDARLGPASYDLVSLLRDSYVEHSPDFVAEMTDEFCRLAGARDAEAEFDLMSLQRNLKALGTFGFQISVKGNHVYLPYVSPTLEMVRVNLERNSRWDELRKSLAGYLPEL